jgi:hypothetical protein
MCVAPLEACEAHYRPDSNYIINNTVIGVQDLIYTVGANAVVQGNEVG